MENGKRLSFERLSALFKSAGFRSNTKYPSSPGGFIVHFDDLTFKTDADTVVTLERCTVDFSCNLIKDEQGKEYHWWVAPPVI